MGQQTTLLRKIYLDETPLLYAEDLTSLPDWKKTWRSLLMDDEITCNSMAHIKKYRKEHNNDSMFGWKVFWNLLSKEYSELFNSPPDDCKKVVRASGALKYLSHTYNHDENSVTINREQELKNARRDIHFFIHDSVEHIKSMYFEKENEGEIWSYLFKQETDSSGERKQIEGWKNHTILQWKSLPNPSLSDSLS